ncbi:MAG: hypothetical protein KBA40_04165 [Candidatus Peribacteraceae bacterium]|nr:hypothetical protein [Candidatus Peribacteraceae bacterium]
MPDCTNVVRSRATTEADILDAFCFAEQDHSSELRSDVVDSAQLIELPLLVSRPLLVFVS